MITEVASTEVVSRIAEWYRPSEYQLVTIAGLDTGAKMELQWIFGAYGRQNDLRIFRAYFDYADTIPTLTPVVPSAWLIERELVDLFGITVAGAKPGVMLEGDSMPAPLRKVKKS